MIDEITESAKAVQEVAKAAGKGIEATEKLGAFVARIMGEPIEAATGILADKLRYMRAERQLRLADRFENILKERNLDSNSRIVPPKLALPIIENASLEENDELQDLWANLLASALDPSFDGTLRSAFIDILKQLEVVDARILSFTYSTFLEYEKSLVVWDHFVDHKRELAVADFGISSTRIVKELGIEPGVYKASIDNLIRVRCLTSYIERKTIEFAVPDMIDKSFDNSFSVPSDSEAISIDHGYNLLALSTLGLDFVEACIKFKS